MLTVPIIVTHNVPIMLCFFREFINTISCQSFDILQWFFFLFCSVHLLIVYVYNVCPRYNINLYVNGPFFFSYLFLKHTFLI